LPVDVEIPVALIPVLVFQDRMGSVISWNTPAIDHDRVETAILGGAGKQDHSG